MIWRCLPPGVSEDFNGLSKKEKDTYFKGLL